MAKCDIRRLHPCVVSWIWSANGSPRATHVESDEVEILIKSWVSPVIVKPLCVEKHRMKDKNSGFFWIEAADIAKLAIRHVVYRDKVVFAVNVNERHGRSEEGREAP